MIRPAVAADLAEILAIYNTAIAETTAVYTEEQVTLADRERWLAAQEAAGAPVLVAVDDQGRVAGYAAYGPFRTFPGFALTVEASVYVARGAWGRGVGKSLLAALIAEARLRGRHVMIAAIDAENVASLRLAEGLGFRRAGFLHEAGRKFGRFLDLVFLELRL